MYPSMLNTIAIIEKINSKVYTLYFTIARERNSAKLFSCSVESVQCIFVFFFVVVVGQLMVRSRVMLVS